MCMFRIIDPTGQGLREYDPWGAGWFGAERPGGRTHTGMDFKCTPGQVVRCPVLEGVMVGTLRPYDDDDTLLGLLLRSTQFDIKMFYVDPLPELIGNKVIATQPVGTAQDITRRYDIRMVPHVHLEVIPHQGSYCLEGSTLYINPKLILGGK